MSEVFLFFSSVFLGLAAVSLFVMAIELVQIRKILSK